MKKFREKTALVLTYIYALGIFVALFGGAVSVLGYLAAFIVGGETAALVSDFIYRSLYPVLVYIATGSVLVGLLKMYVAGEKALTPKKKN